MTTSNHKFIIEAESKLTGIQQAQAAMDNLAARTNAHVRTMTSSFETMVTAVAKITAAVYSVQKAWDLMNLAAKAKQEQQAAANLAASYGSSIEKIVGDLKRASASTIDTMTLVRSAGTAMMMGINPEQVSKLMEIARATARQTGQDVSKAFEDITLAVARQSKMILDNLGIIVSVEKANRDYATSLGRTTDSLTDAEKKQAFLNATVKAGEDLMARLGKQTKSTAEMFQSFSALVQNLKVWIGDALTSIAKWVTIVFTQIGAGINKFIEYIATGVEKIARLLSKLPGGEMLGFGALADAAKAVAENSAMAAEAADKFIGELINLSDEAIPTVGRLGAAIEETGDRSEEAGEKSKWFSEYLTHVNHSLANLTQQSEEAWYAYDQGVETAIVKTKELDTWLQSALAGLAADESIAGMKKWVEDNFSGATDTASKDLEHFLDRMQDLFGDTFNRIGKDGLDSFDDLLANIASLISGSGGEQIAQAFRRNVFEPIAKGAAANWSGLLNSLTPSSPLAGAGMGSLAYSALGGMIGLPQGGYAGLGSGLGAAIGTAFMPGIGTYAGALIGGLGGSLVGGNGKNLQWGLGAGSGLDPGSVVNTAFGRVGAWDKGGGGVDSGEIRAYLSKVAEVTYDLAEGVSRATVDMITAQMTQWTGDKSKEVTAQGLSNKSLVYLKQISSQLGGKTAEIINNWGGTFDELYQYLNALEAQKKQEQAAALAESERAAAAAAAEAQRLQQQALDTILWQGQSAGAGSGSYLAKYLSEKYGMKFGQVTPEWGRQILDWSMTPGLNLESDQRGDIDMIRRYLDALDDETKVRQENIAAIQAQVQATLQITSGIDAINAEWDALYQTAVELGAEQSILDDIEQARIKTIGDYTAAQQKATDADRKRINELASYGAGSAAGAPVWQQAFHYFQNQYGISWDLKTAKQWYGAYQQNWMNQGLVNQVAAGWGMTPEELHQEFGRLGQAIADYEASLKTTTDSVSNLGSAATATYEDLIRMAEQQARQWGGLETSVGGTISDMMFSSANQAPPEERLRAMKKWLKGQRGYDSYEEAQSYYGGLQDYLKLAQEAYQRPSGAYQDQYAYVMRELTKLEEYAAAKEDENLTLIREQTQILSRIENNTARTNVIVVSPGTGAGGTSGTRGTYGGGVMSVDDVIAMLQTDRGRLTIQTIASGQ